jgi:hypothetical protein
MNLLDLIREKSVIEVATVIPATPATTQPQLGRTVATIAKVQVVNPKTENSDISIGVVKSHWWMVHFRDKAPTEICCNPIATADQVLRDIAGAVSAKAIADGSSELGSTDQYGDWSDIETRLVKQRAALFVLRSMASADADALACSLVERDRSGDDRRSCTECVSRSYGRYRHGLEVVGGGGVEVMHRCDRFSQITGGS